MKLKKIKVRDMVFNAMFEAGGWLPFADCYEIANSATRYGITRSALGNFLRLDGRFHKLTAEDLTAFRETRQFSRAVGQNLGSVWALKSDRRWPL